MSEITDLRHQLRDSVTPVLLPHESCSVTAAPSEYEAGLNKLRFSVVIDVGTGEGAVERLDELLTPTAGVKAAIESAGAQVTRSGGHQPLQEGHIGSTWTAEFLT